MRRHLDVPIGRHVADYVSTLTGSEDHREKTRHYLDQLQHTLGWGTLADLRRDSLELWLVRQSARDDRHGSATGTGSRRRACARGW